MSDKAEEFNEFFFFSNIGKTTYERTQQSLRGPHDKTVNNRNPVLREGACFRPEPVDTDTVILTIRSLKETKAHMALYYFSQRCSACHRLIYYMHN